MEYQQPSAQNEDILVVPEMEFCQSKRMTIFLGSIYVYKGLLMVMTLNDTFSRCPNIFFTTHLTATITILSTNKE